MSSRCAISSTVILARRFMVGPPARPSGGRRSTGLGLDWYSIAASAVAWSCLFDTHNDLRLAVDALSGGLLITIYAERRRNVRFVQQRVNVSCPPTLIMRAIFIVARISELTSEAVCGFNML